MDEKENNHRHLQSLGICNKLYNFIKCSAANAIHLVTMHRRCLHGSDDNQAAMPTSSTQSDHVVHPMTQVTPPHEVKVDSDQLDDTAAAAAAALPPPRTTSNAGNSTQAKPPKKTVSINENVELIDISNKKKKNKKKKREKDIDDDEPIKPLKPILKVVSDVSYNDNNSSNYSLISRANGA